MSSTFIKIENNLVTNAILADSAFIQSGAAGNPLLWKEILPTDPQPNVGVGYTYSPTLACFLPPKRFASWIFDQSTYQWVSPIPMPTDGNPYFWSEETQKWMPSDESLYISSTANTATSNAYLADAMKLVGDIIANS